MFCKKCGKIILANSKKCDNCGENTQSVEYCGGFWGLLSEEVPSATSSIPPLIAEESSEFLTPPAKNALTSEIEHSNQQKTRNTKQRNLSRNILFLLPTIVCVFLVLALIIQTGRITSISGRLRKTIDEKIEYQALNSELKKNNEELQSRLDSLFEEQRSAEEDDTIEEDSSTDHFQEQEPNDLPENDPDFEKTLDNNADKFVDDSQIESSETTE